MSKVSDELEQEICTRYQKIIGQETIGLRDTLKILARPEIRDELRAYLNQREVDDLVEEVGFMR